MASKKQSQYWIEKVKLRNGEIDALWSDVTKDYRQHIMPLFSQEKQKDWRKQTIKEASTKDLQLEISIRKAEKVGVFKKKNLTKD